MARARLAVSGNLELLLELLPHANPDMPVLPLERSREIWARTLAREGLYVFVSDAGEQIVASCLLVTAPNLMRGGRQHAFIENVVTHAEYRRRGHGRAVIEAALETAWAEDCHHVLLQSGRKDPGVRAFYETCGFGSGVRTAYVARRPG